MWNSKRIILFLSIILVMAPNLSKAKEEFVYPKDLERDPFEALISKEGIINRRLIRQVGDLELNGIIYAQREEDRIAVINDLLLKKNDYIGSYKIEEINPDSVILNKKGKRIILKMGGEDEK